MNNQSYQLRHINYYPDLPTTINRKDRYIIPLQNQYSILNRKTNPYYPLDNFSLQLQAKYGNKPSPTQLQNQSLALELKEWERKQNQKQNSYKAMKKEIKSLSRLIKLKENQYEYERMNSDLKFNNQTPFMPIPLYMPIVPSFNAFSTSFGTGSCGCQCRCNCQCHQNKIKRKSKKYRPLITENVQNDRQIESLPKLPQTARKPLVQQKLNKPVARVSVKKQVKPPLPKRKKGDLLRRWRKCVYAIYFCFYFKWFSFQFSLNRYNAFKLKYLVDGGKALTSNYKQIYTKMLTMDIPRLIYEAANNIPEPKNKKGDFVQISTLIKKQSIVKLNALSSWSLLSSNREILMGRCSQILLKLIESMTDMLLEWQWGDVGQGMSIGCLNKSFVIDSVFLPHEIYLMNFHDGKGYARITAQAEKIQLMVKLYVKLLLYNVCLQLDNNREWFQQNQKQLQKDQNVDELFIMLQISSKILFILCQNMYEQALEGPETNYGQVSDRFQIEPCNPLVYSHSIKKRRQLFKREDIKQSDLLIYGIDNLDQINALMKESYFKVYEKKLVSAMNNSLDSILEKIKEANRINYDLIKKETLNNQYLILRGLKKVMRSTRYYAFPTTSILQSKKSMEGKSIGTKKQVNSNGSNTKNSIINKHNKK